MLQPVLPTQHVAPSSATITAMVDAARQAALDVDALVTDAYLQRIAVLTERLRTLQTDVERAVRPDAPFHPSMVWQGAWGLQMLDEDARDAAHLAREVALLATIYAHRLTRPAGQRFLHGVDLPAELEAELQALNAARTAVEDRANDHGRF